MESLQLEQQFEQRVLKKVKKSTEKNILAGNLQNMYSIISTGCNLNASSSRKKFNSSSCWENIQPLNMGKHYSLENKVACTRGKLFALLLAFGLWKWTIVSLGGCRAPFFQIHSQPGLSWFFPINPGRLKSDRLDI
jgi:hypothetical protein